MTLYDLINYVTKFLALGTIVLHVVLLAYVVVFIGARFCKCMKNFKANLDDFISKQLAYLILFLSFGGMVASLFYSEIALYEPCVLCWYQRIFMYPLVFLAIAAILYKKAKPFLSVYAMPLIFFGLLIGIYQVLAKVIATFTSVNVDKFLPCSTDPGAVSCLTDYFVEFGYVTIPVMSLTLFVFLTIVTVITLMKEKRG